MNEKEFTERYGEEAFKEEQSRRWEWYENYKKGDNVRAKKYREADPEKYKVRKREWYTKDGKFYEKYLLASRTGQRGERNRVRSKAKRQWGKYKKIIAPLSQIHHEWIPGTADYRGVALVEADQHMHGVVDVIEVLEGKITMLTEDEINDFNRRRI